MGILHSLFGDSSPPSPPQQNQEPTIELSEDEHDVAYPVLVRRSELTAVRRAIAKDRDTPPLEEWEYHFLKDIIDDTSREAGQDDQTFEEHLEKSRQRVETVIASWEADISDDPGVVMLPIGFTFHLHLMLEKCENRSEQEEDPFELPDDFVEALTLFKRLKEAEDGDDAPTVIAHVDDIPTTDSSEDSE